MTGRRVALATILGALALAAPAAAFDIGVETQNFAKTEERNQYIVLTPEFQTRLTQQNIDGAAELAEITVNDPARLPANICASRQQECAGDVRFLDWADAGFGMMEPVLFTARSGAVISGSVWRTQQGSAERPLVVITPGSVQAPENLYWGFAATLAKHGYVVFIYDVQGQGRSDVLGETPDQQEGVPSQAGQPFYDGTEDALDFALSTPTDPYDPRPSCGNANDGTGTDHSPKQDARVTSGLNAAYNPFWESIDSDRVGIAGHSLGAAAVSYIGQIDDRVDGIVAWDNLRASTASSPPDCPSASAPRPANPPMTKPAIGMSNDYGLAPTPNTSDPDPENANGGFSAYKDAGIDSMQVNTRGGTHFEYSFIPGMTVHPLGLATLRGPDMAIWYTTAWLDKYVKCQGDTVCETDADERLLTDRWRSDRVETDIDLNGDGNLYSFYLRSRYDLQTAAGTEVTCEDMRAGCASMTPDGEPAGYSHLADAYEAPDGGGGDPEPCTLPQTGSKAPDDDTTLQPTAAGDAIRGKGGDDNLRGGDGDDCLYGDAGDDGLRGGDGDDQLRGGTGDDRLRGGKGEDKLRGGKGRDVLRATDGEADRVGCGAGRHDEAYVDKQDVVKGSCELVGLAIPR